MGSSQSSRAWPKALRLFWITRVMTSLAALVGLSAVPMRGVPLQIHYPKPGYSKLIELLVGTWERADAGWYLSIAHSGYGFDPGTYAFFPLYPMLIRILNFVSPFPPVFAALLISNLAFLGALYFAYRLAESEIGSDAADRAMAYLAFFPGALFFLAPYTESLFLLLATASVYWARERRWIWAGISGSLLGLTRNLGILIWVPLILEILRQYRTSEPADRPRGFEWASLLLVPVGTLAWILWCSHSTGDPLAFVHAQTGWQRQSMLPWNTVLGGLKQAWDFSLGYPGGGYILEALAVGGAIALLIIGWIQRRISIPLLSFATLALLPPLLAPFEGRLLMSCSRFVAVLFPVFFILGDQIRRDWADQMIRASFLALYGISVAMYVTNQYLY